MNAVENKSVETGMGRISVSAQSTVPALYVVGESDYVGIPEGVESITVPGGHVSPHEAPIETSRAITRVLEMAEERG